MRRWERERVEGGRENFMNRWLNCIQMLTQICRLVIWKNSVSIGVDPRSEAYHSMKGREGGKDERR